MEKEERICNGEEVEDADTLNAEPLTKLHLPSNISSSHTCCKPNTNTATATDENNNAVAVNGNDEPEDKVSIALKLYECGEYSVSLSLFEELLECSVVAKYYMSIMLYDGVGTHEQHHTAVKLMQQVINTQAYNHERLIHCAEYNLGRAYYEGFGVKQSDTRAEEWWLKSARDGEDGGCVKAQTILAMFYSRTKEETFDLKKAYFWHQEATGNGSLESQTALGMMYEHGIGVEQSEEHSFRCLKAAAERGSVYAMGNLALKFYANKMFRNSCDLAKKLSQLEDIALLSRQTDCLEAYIRKGIAMGCFLYGRCILKGIAEVEQNETPGMWYSKAAAMDLDVTQMMQDLVVAGKI